MNPVELFKIAINCGDTLGAVLAAQSIEHINAWDSDLKVPWTDARDSRHLTPLIYATVANNYNVVEALLSNHAYPNATSFRGSTPLFYAHTLEMAEYLVGHGASTSTVSTDGDTVLHCGLDKRDLAVVEYLVSHGANVSIGNIAGDTPLHVAVRTRSGIEPIVKCLISAGADLNAQDMRGRTAMHDAVGLLRWPYVELLLQSGADPGIRDHKGKTPLQLVRETLPQAQSLFEQYM